MSDFNHGRDMVPSVFFCARLFHSSVLPYCTSPSVYQWRIYDRIRANYRARSSIALYIISVLKGASGCNDVSFGISFTARDSQALVAHKGMCALGLPCLRLLWNDGVSYVSRVHTRPYITVYVSIMYVYSSNRCWHVVDGRTYTRLWHGQSVS